MLALDHSMILIAKYIPTR